MEEDPLSFLHEQSAAAPPPIFPPASSTPATITSPVTVTKPAAVPSPPLSPPITTVYAPTTNNVDVAVEIMSRIAQQTSDNLQLSSTATTSTITTVLSTTTTTTTSLSPSPSPFPPLSPSTTAAATPPQPAGTMTVSKESLKKTLISSSECVKGNEKGAEKENFSIKSFDTSDSDSEPNAEEEAALKESHARCEKQGVVVEGISESKEFSQFVTKRSLENFFSRLPSNFDNYLDNIGEMLNFHVTMHQKCSTVYSKLKEMYGFLDDRGLLEFGCFLCPKHCPCEESPSYKFAGRPSTRNRNGPGRRPKKPNAQVKKTASKPPLKRARKQKVKSKQFVEESVSSSSSSNSSEE